MSGGTRTKKILNITDLRNLCYCGSLGRGAKPPAVGIWWLVMQWTRVADGWEWVVVQIGWGTNNSKLWKTSTLHRATDLCVFVKTVMNIWAPCVRIAWVVERLLWDFYIDGGKDSALWSGLWRRVVCVWRNVLKRSSYTVCRVSRFLRDVGNRVPDCTVFRNPEQLVICSVSSEPF